MKRVCIGMVCIFSLMIGCAEDTPVSESGGDSGNSAISADGDSLGTPTDGMDDSAGDGNAAPADSIALSPDNTRIAFTGTHTDGTDPHDGRFGAFTGTASMADGALAELVLEIETASITSDNEKLTAHLKSADFFDVREKPSAAFKSTGIVAGDDGSVTVTGDLTMLGETQSISFPASVSTDDGLTLSAEFSIDRTLFGMNYGVDKIDKMVAMKVSIGG